MRVTCLMDNVCGREGLCSEHGLSLYIETNGQKILFDTGAGEGFSDNAGKCGIDLRTVDFAVLSHGHYDHGGGLHKFSEINDHAPIYVSSRAFGCHVDGEKYIGLDPSLEEKKQIILLEDSYSPAPWARIETFRDKPLKRPIEHAGLSVKKGGRLDPEKFEHEQYLIIREGDKTVLFSGCSHRGILNIMSWLVPDVLIGGFHLFKADPDGEGRKELTETASELMRYPTLYYTGHCTGETQYVFLRKLMGDKIRYLAVGNSVTI